MIRETKKSKSVRKRTESSSKFFFSPIHNEPDEIDIINKLHDIESGKFVVENWKNPIPTYNETWYGRLRVLNAPLDPVWSRSGDWVMAGDLNVLPIMYQSYLRVLMIFYVFVGVTALRLCLDSPYYADSNVTIWLSLISRFSWTAECLWCIGAVVGIFHTLWAIYAVPAKHQRKFVLDNARWMSHVYTYGAFAFVLVIIGVLSGSMAFALQDKFPTSFAIATALGLFVSLVAMASYIYVSGALVAANMRPWRIAYDEAKKELEQNLNAKRREKLMGQKRQRASRDGIALMKDVDTDMPTFQNLTEQDLKDHAALTEYGVQEHGPRLRASGLVLSQLASLRNPTLADQLLQGAGIHLPGDRVQILLLLQKQYPLSDADIRNTSQQLSKSLNSSFDASSDTVAMMDAGAEDC